MYVFELKSIQFDDISCSFIKSAKKILQKGKYVIRSNWVS